MKLKTHSEYKIVPLYTSVSWPVSLRTTKYRIFQKYTFLCFSWWDWTEVITDTIADAMLWIKKDIRSSRLRIATYLRNKRASAKPIIIK